MPIFRAGTPIKFKPKHPLPEEVSKRLHATADGYLVGVYFPAHLERTPEVRDADGNVTAEATEAEVPESVSVMCPGGNNVMVPVYGPNGHAELKKLSFAMSEIDDAHAVDDVCHMPPGRKCHEDWKPTPRKCAKDIAK